MLVVAELRIQEPVEVEQPRSRQRVPRGRQCIAFCKCFQKSVVRTKAFVSISEKRMTVVSIRRK